MQSNIYRRKLLNAVLFFAVNTKYVGLGKLSKLLYFLDFTHFKQTGYPSIGLEYFTFKKGPVPRDFWLEIKDGDVPGDFVGKVALLPIEDDLTLSRRGFQIKAIGKPDLSVFTPREIKILGDLAFIYKDARFKDMTEVTHLPKQPWDITLKQSGENKPIDYLLGIDDKSEVSLDDAKESLKEHQEAVRNFGLSPTK
ncbi:MAG: SocA family protein [Dehalococcoidia bacterium]|nr:SocA family protein [Dehalococcoidia bacterium]